MLSKLKTQLEELRSKVVFLDCVKKHLEVLRRDPFTFDLPVCVTCSVFLQVLGVEQWGLEVSSLPSLAACTASDHLPVLSFGCSRGKSSVQAGSPPGLMSYLYARCD